MTEPTKPVQFGTAAGCFIITKTLGCRSAVIALEPDEMRELFDFWLANQNPLPENIDES
jgi:hypothetical protein